MKFFTLALALLALPATMADEVVERDAAPAHELEERTFGLDWSWTFGSSSSSSSGGACTPSQAASCYIRGRDIDANCNCKSGYSLSLNQPCGTKRPTYCTSVSALAACWAKGQSANNLCQCEGTPVTTPAPTSKTSSSIPATTPAGTCKDWFQVAVCALAGKKTDANCHCITGTPVTPGGHDSGCTSPDALAQCWKQGWGCNAKCVCTTPSSSVVTPTSTSVSKTSSSVSKTSSTPAPAATTSAPPGLCKDWFQVAICALGGKKTDANCNCITGTPVTPGGHDSGCTSPDALAKCWMQGWGCNAKCVCVSTSSSVTPTPSTTKSPVPTSTPTQVGQCKNALSISICALRGQGVKADCTCLSCPCTAQWDCIKKGGTLDHNTCACVLPSGVKRRRDASYVNNLCSKGYTACRVDSANLGWDGKFECVDTASNIESCGGCVAEGLGEDCTSIEGAHDVACISSKCVVSSCADGWKLVDGTCQPESNAARLQQKVIAGAWRA